MRSKILAVLLISAATQSVRADDRSDQLQRDGALPLTAPFDEAKAKAIQEAWAKHLGKSSPFEKNSIEMELVLIPPGKFRMGSPASETGRKDAEAQVDVKLTKAFYLGKTPVTQGQWRAVMETTPWKGEKYVVEGDNYPATIVSWDDAKLFCKKLSEKESAAYRLPTEAEWEYACRAGTTTRFSFGDDESQLGEHAWFDKNTWDIGEKYAHEVGRKKPNPFGLHDMHGNVWQWCEDAYADKFRGGTDPLIAAGGASRVNRGGGWGSDGPECRSADRGRLLPSSSYGDLGFRIVRSIGR